MAEINLFEVATRKKLRFNYHGRLSVEDLWELPVEKLDSIYKSLNAEAKKETEESLLHTKSKEAELLTVKIDIVKYIVTVKLEEVKAREAAMEQKKYRQRIAEIIAEKKDEQLKNLSIEELEKLIK